MAGCALVDARRASGPGPLPCPGAWRGATHDVQSGTTSDCDYCEIYGTGGTLTETVNALKRQQFKVVLAFVALVVTVVVTIGGYLLVIHFILRDEPILSECMACIQLENYCQNKDVSAIKDLRAKDLNTCCIKTLWDAMLLIQSIHLAAFITRGMGVTLQFVKYSENNFDYLRVLVHKSYNEEH